MISAPIEMGFICKNRFLGPNQNYGDDLKIFGHFTMPTKYLGRDNINGRNLMLIVSRIISVSMHALTTPR